jgi:Flp pilus assembly protein TadD
MTSSAVKLRDRRLTVGICCVLVALIWIAFGQTLGHDFINYDDPQYVTANRIVAEGITAAGIKWAFTHRVASNWHPLTMLSHMVDCELFGLKAGGHHATNLILHTLTAVFLFLVLRKMTAATRASAFTAALFALHPLRVESVAWISERKDVLSGFFFVLTLAAYLGYVRQRSVGRYLLVLFLFVLGLLSKPMLVTLPLVLLLLDRWPLRRDQSGRSLLLEKLPLCALSLGLAAITLLLQTRTISSIAMIPLPLRLYNVATSYLLYIRQMIRPTRLGLFYPYPSGTLSAWALLIAVALLCVVTFAVWHFRERRPYLLTGWFWYLIMLMPVIGFIQVGRQAHADRYTYLPQIGLYLAVIWLILDLSRSWRYRPQILGSLAVIVIASLTSLTHAQAAHWRDSESIWRRTLAVTSNNATAHKNLGLTLLKKSQVDEAISHLREALELSPDYIAGHRNPDNASLHENLGTALLTKRHFKDAAAQFKKASELDPDSPELDDKLARALFQDNDVAGAITHWQKSLAAHPGDPTLHASLATAFSRQGSFEEAVAHYEKALAAAPESIPTLNNFALLLATCSDPQFRDGERAVDLATKAKALSGGQNPSIIRTLAAAYAEAGRFKEASETAGQALQLALAQGDSSLAGELRLEISLYALGLPRRTR